MYKMASSSETNAGPGWLKRVSGRSCAELVPLNRAKFIIGRHFSSDLVVPDAKISRSHCILNFDSVGWNITDLGSINGTYLDGKKLSPNVSTTLKNVSLIFLGPPWEDAPSFVFLDKLDEPSLPSVEEFNGNDSNLACSVRHEGKRGMPTFTRGECADSNDAHAIKRRRIEHPAFLHSGGFSVSNEPVINANEDLSDCSLSSLDSLNTRIRKLRKRDSMSSSTSGSNNVSPSLNHKGLNSLDAIPSTSNLPDRKIFYPEAQIEGLEFHGSQFAKAMSWAVDSLEDSESLLEENRVNCAESACDRLHKPVFTCGHSHSEKDSGTCKCTNKRCKDLENKLHQTKIDMVALERRDKKHKLLLKKLLQSEKSKKVDFLKILEEELSCTICTEILTKATVLNCCHIFCELCILTWKRKKKQCPMCRERITTENRLLIMDGFIDKFFQHLGSPYLNKRQELLKSRSEAVDKFKVNQKRKRKKQVRRVAQQARNLPSVNPPPFDIPLLYPPQSRLVHSFDNRPLVSIEVINIQSDHDDHLPSTNEIQELENELSDSSTDGHGYNNGFGRCHNCGRRGHWANGCPTSRPPSLLI